MRCFTLYLRAISEYKPPGGAYIWRGDLTEGYCVKSLGCLYLEGLLHGGAYFRNFTVFSPKLGVKIKCDFLGALVLVMHKYKYKKTFVIGSTQRDLITINYNKS